MTRFELYMQRQAGRHGDKFDSSELDPRFVPFYNSEERIQVEFADEFGTVYDIQRGTVGVTTGWRPAFLLMHNRVCSGSSTLLGRSAKVVAKTPYMKRRREL